MENPLCSLCILCFQVHVQASTTQMQKAAIPVNLEQGLQFHINKNLVLLKYGYPPKPAGHWKNEKNQREFFEKFAEENGVKEPKDWGKISYRHLSSKGGSAILKHHKNSILETLKNVFPGTVHSNIHCLRNKLASLLVQNIRA